MKIDLIYDKAITLLTGYIAGKQDVISANQSLLLDAHIRGKSVRFNNNGKSLEIVESNID